MQIHDFAVEAEAGQAFPLFLASDLHLGHSAVDRRRIAADLDAARAARASVILNGDVLDAVSIKDKRHRPSQVDGTIRHRDDLIQAQVELAFSTLAPYADLIRVIGCGNHEEAVLKYASDDPTARLVGLLNHELGRQGSPHRVRHGGIAGFIRHTFRDGRGASVGHTLAYHHGAGGDAPVTKGAIAFDRIFTRYDADAVTMGHRHNRTVIYHASHYLSRSGRIRKRVRIGIQTASYLDNYVATGQDNPTAYTYAESSAGAPKPMGGWFLILTPERHRDHDTAGSPSLRCVRQEVATSWR